MLKRHGSHLIIVIMDVGVLNLIYIIWDPFEKVRSSPPPIDLNGTALIEMVHVKM